MNDAVGVCVLDCLSELAHEVDLTPKVQLRAVVCEPEVESLVAGGVRKDEPASELVRDDVQWSEDARMV